MKKLLYVLLFLILIAAIAGFYLYNSVWASNVSIQDETADLYIPTGSNFSDLKNILESENMIENLGSFELTAKLMKYNDSSVKSGLYEIKKDWSNRQLIKHLRIGKQKPVNLTFNNFRTIEELIGAISRQVESDSISLLNYVTEQSFLDTLQISRDELLCQFLPNTYEVYWNTSIDKLVGKLLKEKEKFWSANNRIEKAQSLNLSPTEVCILASIVEKETLVADEKNTVAGVYLNRLKRNIMLQADPTVVYAVGDFSIRRVLNKHLEFDSPYNTYRYEGLPPGPIYLPDNNTVDAVLNPEEHSYLYFCAKPDNSGRHAFAKNLIDHNKNARTYQNWLNKRGIRK